MTNKFKRLDLTNHTGRIFVVGDIHGAFSKLEATLADIGFSWDADVLLSVGDLVDRGPENERCIEFLERPNFHAIQGNHEQLCYTLGGRGIHAVAQNGGRWFGKLYYKDIVLYNKIKSALFNLPILMEVLLPSGKKIGIAHACYPHDNWADADQLVHNHPFVEQILWDREPLRALRDKSFLPGNPVIKNIDHVYYGHTPMKEPFHIGNQSWIDTGAVFGNNYKFTIIEVN